MHCRGYEHRQGHAAILVSLLGCNCGTCQEEPLSTEMLVSELLEEQKANTYSSSFFGVTSCEATVFFEFARKACKIIVVMLPFEGTSVLLGEGMLLCYDGFFDAAESIYYPTRLTHQIVKFGQAR
jgi:hypothetical protein